MKKRLLQLLAAALAALLCVPCVGAVQDEEEDHTTIRVGLASTSSHNAMAPQKAAHLQNNTDYGAGFRFGYYDEDLEFVELARTGEDVTEIAVLKTQNLYYGLDPELNKNTYSDAITSDILVGCYHIQLSYAPEDYEEAAELAADWDGFVAWFGGEYRVRLGDYPNRESAETAFAELGLDDDEAEIRGTSAYGMNVVKLGTDEILFQYDDGEGCVLGIMPDVTEAEDVRTWFSNYKYRGGFAYQRIDGGNLTIVNVLDLEDYVKGVVCYEMGREWPLEALKAQATCARTYALENLKYHDSLGFDICNSDYCQVYYGTGTARTDYGPTETSDRAVDETAGQVVWYKDTLAKTFYSSSHGGASESANYIWGTNMEVYPYLCGVEDPYEETINDLNPYSPWTVTLTSKELTQRLRSHGYGTNTKVDSLELTYSELGNVVKVKVLYENGQSNTFTPRTKPSIINLFGVRSIRFTVNGQTVNQSEGEQQEAGEYYAVNGSDTLKGLDGLYVITGKGTVEKAADKLCTISGKGNISALEPTQVVEESVGSNQGGGTVTISDNSYTLNGGGWGHQIGMSQFGANAMARLDFTFDEIVEFYFPGTHVDSYYEN